MRGLNRAALELAGDVRGRYVWSVVAPDDRVPAREQVARHILSPTHSEFATTLRDSEGRLHSVEVSSTSLLDPDGNVVGVFGLLRSIDVAPASDHPGYHLTPRQQQVLACLVAGASTAQMAEKLGLAPETVRNHVRGLLRAMGVHSRVEAVAQALRDGLVQPSRPNSDDSTT